MPVTDINTGTQTGEAGLGFGLNGVADYSTQHPFIDVFKTARAWTGHEEGGGWGGISATDLRTMGVLDEHGWIISMPEDVTHIESFLLTEQPEEAEHLAGRYRVSWEGEGSVQLNGARNVSYSDGQAWFDYTPTGSNMVSVVINDTDPSGTGDYIRDISVVHEDNIAAFDEGKTFDPLFLETISGVHELRFMDWMHTNNSEVSSWEEAPSQGDYTYSEGVPVEEMVALANETGSEPWFNIPYHADEEYIETFASYVRDNLDPDLRAHYEFSNEVWNFQFQQAQDAIADSQERFGEALSDGWMQHYGASAAEMTDVLDRVYEGQEEALVKVVATSVGWPGLEQSILEAPAWQEMGNEAPHESFDTYAVTGYFGVSLGSDKADTVRGWIEESREAAESAADEQGLAGEERAAWVEAHQYDRATELAEQELRDGSVTGDPAGSLAELREMFDYHAKAAAEKGLDLVMYEGGTHVVGVGENAQDQELTDFFTHFNYSEEMGDLYDELLSDWEESGGTLFNAFVDVGQPSQWGSWGSLRYQGDETARHDALMEFNEENPRPWEDEASEEEDDTGDTEGEDGDETGNGDADGEDENDDMGDVDPDDPDMPGEDDDQTGSPGEDPEEDEVIPDDVEEEDDPESSGGSGTCFVATAAYLDPLHPDVRDLRRFRDEHLVHSRAGRAFVATYWKVGPHLARYVRGYPRRAAMCRALLTPAVRVIRARLLA